MKDSWFHPDRIGTYKGEMKDGLAHGKGTYTSKHKGKTGNYKYFYKGSFVNGLKHGKAKQVIHLPKYTIKYEGNFKNDLSDGHGVLTMISKGKLEQKYIGEFKKGYRHGKGKLIDYFQKWTKQGRFVKGYKEQLKKTKDKDKREQLLELINLYEPKVEVEKVEETVVPTIVKESAIKKPKEKTKELFVFKTAEPYRKDYSRLVYWCNPFEPINKGKLGTTQGWRKEERIKQYY